MKTDVTHLLREANPVVDQAPYTEAELRRRIDAITGAPTRSDAAGATVIALVDRPPEVARRRRLLAVVAAVGVAVVAAAGLTIARQHTSSTGSGAPTTSCQVSGNPSTARSMAVRTVITDRIAARGGHAVAIRLNGRTVSFTARGIDARTAVAVCAPTTAALRPLIMSPVDANATGPHSPTPLAGLGFAVPRNAKQLITLRPSQRTRLMTAMARYDCSAAGSRPPSAPTLACGGSTGRPLVYLLGPAVVTSSGVSSAIALAPGQSPGGTQWTVQLNFTATGQAAIAEYTHQQNAPRSVGLAFTCSAKTVLCSDFLAAVLNNRAQAPAQVHGPIAGSMVISGGFDRSAATTLADDLTAAAIGLMPATR